MEGNSERTQTFIGKSAFGNHSVQPLLHYKELRARLPSQSTSQFPNSPPNKLQL